MALLERLTVVLNFGTSLIEVGEIVTNKKKYFFKYYPSFLERKIEISPFKLPLNSKIQTPSELFFDGLFGVFNDSLPDGWGRLLVDRHLLKNGFQLQQITALDRLSLINNNGLGALEYKPQEKIVSEKYNSIQLDTIAQDMQVVLQGESNVVIEELYNLGGSSGGARPKIMVGYNEKTNKLVHDKAILPKDFEHWIIKFPSSTDMQDIAQIEYAYYLMAVNAGISMSKSQLFKSKKNDYFFGTKRFDRDKNNKLHLHSASGLLHDNFRLSSLDYGHIMNAAFQLENHINGYEKVFRLACFNMLAHNRDDHSKNFAFLMNEKGKWQFAPAYDLTFSSSSHGQHSTTINGEGVNPTQKHLLKLAENFDMKNAVHILEEVKQSINNWTTFANQANVSKASTKLIEKVIENQLKNY
ncbi:MAG: phosphatidylinositol kinase [Lutibacter sp.]|nr:MAG: phosphatidylinositol kinase [Lutibacter sp.]